MAVFQFPTQNEAKSLCIAPKTTSSRIADVGTLNYIGF